MLFFLGKLRVTTNQVSKARKFGIRQYEALDDSGSRILVDEDCTNNQVDVEECIIRSNRFFPCSPPERDLAKYKKLYAERVEKFAQILPSFGYKLVPAKLNYEAGDIKSYEILNYDDKYEQIAKEFVNGLPEEKQPPVYENFKQSFLRLQALAPKNSLKFNKFEKVLKQATCEKQLIDLPGTLDDLNTKLSIMMKKFNNAEKELYNIQESIPSFLQQLSRNIPQVCDESYFNHVENKITMIDALKWNCKEI